MTTYEVITIIIIWIAYGVFAAYKTKEWCFTILFIIFSPLVFVVRYLLGAFYYEY